MHKNTKKKKVKFAPFFSISMKRKRLRKHNVSFNEELKTGEDFDFLLHLTEKKEITLFVPNIVQEHDFLRGNILNFFKRFYAYAKDRNVLYKMHSKKYNELFYDIRALLPRKKFHVLFLPLFIVFKSAKLSSQMIESFTMKKRLFFPAFLYHLIFFHVFYTNRDFTLLLRKRIQKIFKQTPEVSASLARN